jgi:hypothetical protein
VKAKFETDGRRLIKSGKKVLNKSFSHTTTCGVTAPVLCSTVSWLNGGKMRSFGDLEIKDSHSSDF